MPGKKDKKKSKGKNAEVGVAGVDDALRNMSQTTISATDNPLGGKLPAVGEGIGYDEREAKAARNTRHAAHGTLRYSTAESHARFAAPPPASQVWVRLASVSLFWGSIFDPRVHAAIDPACAVPSCVRDVRSPGVATGMDAAFGGLEGLDALNALSVPDAIPMVNKTLTSTMSMSFEQEYGSAEDVDADAVIGAPASAPHYRQL